MKKFTQTFILLLSLILALPALAYMQCPAGVDPNGANNTGVACYWVDESGVTDGQGQTEGNKPQVSNVPDFYMAVVGHPDTPLLWSSTGYLSPDDAEQAALGGCLSSMKSGCTTLLRVHNSQYVGVVRDKTTDTPYVSSSASTENATDAAMQECKKHSNVCYTNGRIPNTIMQTDNFPPEPVKRYPVQH
jgi:hypothetical protein